VLLTFHAEEAEIQPVQRRWERELFAHRDGSPEQVCVAEHLLDAGASEHRDRGGAIACAREHRMTLRHHHDVAGRRTRGAQERERVIAKRVRIQKARD
jgi:hypothetical protein